jgi:murein L,D-transpeptidase YafK
MGLMRCFLTVISALCLGIASLPAQSSSTQMAAETLLGDVFSAVKARQLDVALSTAETLVGQYPNFRLAHLIRGDLLLARTRPLSTLGEVAFVGQQPDPAMVAALRDEARVRMTAYRSAPEKAALLPRDLIRLAPRHEYAVVVDTARARLYVFQNALPYPEKVADFYISHGKAGADKRLEGDNRTPLGVYHVTHFIPPNRLPDFYGTGAFPINYPNPRDRQLGRTGYGIWLHGSPPDTYARPPLASEGCVVLANDDLVRLASFVRPGTTPVIIGENLEWVSQDQWLAGQEPFIKALEAWRTDWESLDVSRYLAHYAPAFVTEKQTLAQWAEQKTRLARQREWIRVGVDDVSILRNPADPSVVEVTFRQQYESDGLSDVMLKRQFWQYDGQRWQILYEGQA